MSRTVEIRTYRLKPGSGPAFHEGLHPEGHPAREAVRHGCRRLRFSANDPNGYFLMRAFASLEDRQATEDAFYSSDSWRKRPAAVHHRAHRVLPGHAHLAESRSRQNFCAAISARPLRPRDARRAARPCWPLASSRWRRRPSPAAPMTTPH